MKRYGLLSLSIFLTMICFQAQASLRFEERKNIPYYNRNHIDSYLGTANMTFVYKGCDPTPSESNIELVRNGDCKDAENYNLGSEGGRTATSGRVGEIVAIYSESEGTPKTCSKPTIARLHTTKSLRSLFQEFQTKAQCKPTHLVIMDGTEGDYTYLPKAVDNKGICDLPSLKVTKKGFPSEDHDFFKLSFNDKGFKVGDHTTYNYDYQRQQWCVQYKENKAKCGNWPLPLPMTYKDSGDNRQHVKSVIQLHQDGSASFRAIDTSYKNEDEMWAAQAKGDFLKTDKSKGRIDFQSRRLPTGLVKGSVRSFSVDQENAVADREISILERNVFGRELTQTWCSKEHCFAAVQSSKMKPSICDDKKDVDMTARNTGNVCYSCVGVTPGRCAVNPGDVSALQANLSQDNDFFILATGEYRLNKRVENGLVNNYDRIIANPSTLGCTPDQNLVNPQTFDFGEAQENRVLQSVPKKQ